MAIVVRVLDAYLTHDTELFSKMVSKQVNFRTPTSC
jgi:hypothetical protein